MILRCFASKVKSCFSSSLQKSCVDRLCTSFWFLSLFADIKVSTHLNQVRDLFWDFFLFFLDIDGFLGFPFEDGN